MNEYNETNSMMLIEGLSLNRVSGTMRAIADFQKVVKETLQEDLDYGASFKGSKKPSLLKPGAEKILMLLGLSSEYEIIEKIQDYQEGFFAYTIKCTLLKGDIPVTEGLGHCNSKERKYEGDNQDKFMLGNTCLKMAKKRAQVDAALTVGSLSNIFTQDLEDMVQFEAEELKTMTKPEAENLKLGFGKHKGKTLGQILKEAPDYIEWLAENANDAKIKAAADMLLIKQEAIKAEDPKQKATAKKSEQASDDEYIHPQEDLPWGK